MNALRIEELEFEAVPHRYLVRGREIPSVTHVMRELGLGFVGFAPQEALDRGNYVHEASVLIDEDALDWDAVPEKWRGYCESYRRTLLETRSRPFRAEWRFFHPSFGYAGTLDRVVLRDARFGLIEIKSGSTRHVHIQGGGYFEGWRYWNPTRELSFGECWRVQEDGSPAHLIPFDLGEGWADFAAALRVYRRKGDPAS